jgi:4-amino-4-deoxy-L-arabinose transferase-like glycosyltransferase
MNPANPPRFLGLSAGAVVVLLLAVQTLFRFFYCTWVPILPDEAYYFQWSKHLDACYISKGPAVAYTIAVSTWLFGGNNFGIRFFAVLLSAGTGWQIFLLARRWFNDAAGVVAVLIASVVPLFAVGAVLMTIDPLSAFFWVWAANWFSQAVQEDRLAPWLWTGFAAGSGFLAKQINAVELLAFVIFLGLTPHRRRLLAGGRFWAMIGVAVLCTLPMWWWNAQHGWPMIGQLAQRGKLGGSGTFHIRSGTFFEYVGMQALVISPLTFISMLVVAGQTLTRCWRARTRENEGELFLLVLFLCVFSFYAVLSWHTRCEANWAAVGYLSMVVLLSARWRDLAFGLGRSGARAWMVAAFLVGMAMTVSLHNTSLFHLSLRRDPMSRSYGWQDVARRVEEIRRQERPDAVMVDAYREAAEFSYYLPGQPYVYTVKNEPPANQFDLWPAYPTAPGVRVLWIRGKNSTMQPFLQFNKITPLEQITVKGPHGTFREYTVWRCENR